MTLQIFVLSPEPQIPSQTLTLTTSSTQTLHHLKLSLLPKPLTESFSSSFYFTLNGKPPPDSTLLESPQIAPLSTLSGRKHGINVKVVEKMVSSKLDENGKSANGGVVNGSSKRFKGEKIHDILFQVLEKEGDVIIRHGTQSIENRHAASQGMHTSKFGLNPAGDTPSACQLFDSMVSLCIPVIISDSIELPFEDVIDYTKIGIFVDSMSALKP